MTDDYFYYIIKKPFRSDVGNCNVPEIFKIKTSNIISFSNVNDGEGPFTSLYELRKGSLIYNGIKHQKHKNRILKNVREVVDFIFSEKDSTYTPEFIKSFHHALVGKFEKHTLKGIHFYDPRKTKILETIKISEETGVWKALISQYNDQTNMWIDKNKPSTFFPTDWSINRLFHECDFAYRNKVQVTDLKYIGETDSGIRVEFIINSKDKIISFYPLID